MGKFIDRAADASFFLVMVFSIIAIAFFLVAVGLFGYAIWVLVGG